MDQHVIANGPRRINSISSSSHATIRARRGPHSASSSADEGSQGGLDHHFAGGPVRRFSAASEGALESRNRSGHPVHARHDSSDSSGSNHPSLPSLASRRSDSWTSASSTVEDEARSSESEFAAAGNLGDIECNRDMDWTLLSPRPNLQANSRPLPSPRPEAFHIEDVAAYESHAMTIQSAPLIVVIGVGYVGEHLVNVFSRKFNVVGYDISSARAEQLSGKFQDNDKVIITADTSFLGLGTHFLISVPTLLGSDKKVDSSFLQSALETVALHAKPASTIVIESSVAVGMTREFLGPIAREKGFFAGMSPERVDPGRTEPPAHSIPKVVSGLDDVVPGSLEAICRVYRAVFDRVVPVSRPEVAEMMKLYENCQRMVCIAFANEMADACNGHGVDPFEVCRAAATKPFGYMSMMPSLGVGGHCIPVNPYYLLSNNDFPLLHAATEKMNARPGEIARRSVRRLYMSLGIPFEDESDAEGSSVVETPFESDGDESDPEIWGPYRFEYTEYHREALRRARGSSLGEYCVGDMDVASSQGSADTPDLPPRVLVVGIGFKAGQAHLVNSPGVELAKSLAAMSKVSVSWCDPLVTQLAFMEVPRFDEAKWSKEALEKEFKMIIVAHRQHGLDFGVLERLQGVEVEMWCP